MPAEASLLRHVTAIIAYLCLILTRSQVLRLSRVCRYKETSPTATVFLLGDMDMLDYVENKLPWIMRV